VRELGDATVGQRAAAVWWPSSMVLMAIGGCCRRRGHSPRLGLGVALATIGTAAGPTRHSPPSGDIAVAPGWVAADCAGFRAGAESVVPATALIARRKWPSLTCLLRLSRARGAALLAARSRNEEKQGDC
jgi:hypothetical protein